MGGKKTKHPGNQSFKKLVESVYEEYEKGDQLQKKDVLTSIISRITRDGGRFLQLSKQDDRFSPFAHHFFLDKGDIFDRVSFRFFK